MGTLASRILTVGLPADLAPWLASRLDGVRVQPVENARQALPLLAAEPWSLLVLDQGAAVEVLEGASQGRPAVICCLGEGAPGDMASMLVRRFRVERLLTHPLDRDDLAYQVSALLHIPLRSEDRVGSALAVLWERFKEVNIQRVAVLEDAAVVLLQGGLDETLRRRALGEAHKLAGAVGTFGFAAGSRLARQAEDLLASAAALGLEQGLSLSDVALRLREELGRPRPTAARPEEAPGREATRLLIVGQDSGLAANLAAAAGGRGLAAAVVAGVDGARAAIGQACPDVVLLDLGAPESIPLLAELSTRTPPVPVVVSTDRDQFFDRVQAARHGGRGFLVKPLSTEHVLDAIEHALRQAGGQDASVLCVDDDPQVLATLRALLHGRHVRVTTLEDPLRFWDVLGASAPDLLVLDVDLPHLDGIEICRVVRNDRHWSSLPVLFLTAHTDAETLRRVFAAGGDDFVAKPIIGPELVSRVANRLERTRLLRRLAETDPLTGLANRRKADREIDRMIRLASRQGQPLCLALLDIDHLKGINDRHGHGAGDRVLCRLADLLARAFRAEDLACRWGGDEFLIAMYAMRREDGVARLAAVLEAMREQSFQGAADGVFGVTLTAGVAEYPDDGGDLERLCGAADQELFRAKEAGRDRVRAGGADPAVGSAGSADVDVALVDDDEALAGLLLHALKTRGYRTAWLSDGREAVEALAGPDARLRPRVALLDVDLPGLDGLSILRRLARDGHPGATRVIVLTARASESEVLAAMDLGAFDHVAKPFSLPVLMRRIRRALEA